MDWSDLTQQHRCCWNHTQRKWNDHLVPELYHRDPEYDHREQLYAVWIRQHRGAWEQCLHDRHAIECYKAHQDRRLSRNEELRAQKRTQDRCKRRIVRKFKIRRKQNICSARGVHVRADQPVHRRVPNVHTYLEFMVWWSNGHYEFRLRFARDDVYGNARLQLYIEGASSHRNDVAQIYAACTRSLPDIAGELLCRSCRVRYRYVPELSFPQSTERSNRCER